jgi:hypothetical protein
MGHCLLVFFIGNVSVSIRTDSPPWSRSRTIQAAWMCLQCGKDR